MTPTTPRWKQEFGDVYDVPDFIALHPDLVDLSWHNDQCPSFGLKGYVYDSDWPDIRLWIEHPDPAQRLDSDSARLMVSESGDTTADFESNTTTNTNGCAVHGWRSTLEGFAEALEVLKRKCRGARPVEDDPARPRVVLCLQCPHCGFALTELNDSSNTRNATGGFDTICESCCVTFTVTVDDIHAAQHQLLIALGEA